MKYSLTICWLYPEYMSTYGDRGNLLCLSKRCQWRGIEVKITGDLKDADLVFGGGAQDRQQSLIIDDLLRQKERLREMFAAKIPGLFVCGSPQLLGHYYETNDGKKLPGLGIFDMVTKSGFGKPRLIGNLVARLCHPEFIRSKASLISGSKMLKQVQHDNENLIVGFENHSGRTYLGNVKPFGKVLFGFGNNGEDGTEGAVYQNVIATYAHGPFLPKNPRVADWLIEKALCKKYGNEVELEPLDDRLEWQAHNFILKKLRRFGS